MTIKSGQSWAGSFVTLDATGALKAATGTPAGTLYVDGIANPTLVTVTGSNPYKWVVTLPTLTAGQRVYIYVTATIDSIATAGFVASEQADTIFLSDGVTLADDAITADKFDESTAYPLKSADTGSTQVARVGADSDTLQTLSDQLDTAQAELNNPAQYKADVSGLAQEATLTAIKGDGWTNETLKAIRDALATAQADLDNTGQYKANVSELATASALSTISGMVDDLETRLTAERASYLDKLNVAGTLANSSDANTYKADVSGLAPAGEYDTELAAIKDDLDNPDQYKADVSSLATTTHIQEVEDKIDIVDTVADSIKDKTDQLAFTTANKVDATATMDPTGIATSEELELIGEKVDGVLDKLNVSSVEFVTAIVGSTITILRGDTLTVSLLNLGSMESYVSLDFTVKLSKVQEDADALIRIRLNASGSDDGLLTLKGAAPSSSSDGSIVITDEVAGDITIKLAASCTDDLVAGTYTYDVQLIEAGKVSTLTSGKTMVVADVTRAVA